jgi:type I restriction enzyme S subunit
VREVVHQVSEKVKVEKTSQYKLIGVKWYGEGTFHRETVTGDEISATYLTPVIPNAFIYNRLFAWKESFAVVPPEHEGHFVSNEFPQFFVDESRVLARYLYLFFTLDSTIQAVNAASVGSAAVSRNRFKEEEFLRFELPLPPLEMQRAIVARWQQAQAEIASANERVKQLEAAIDMRFYGDLGLKPPTQAQRPKVFAVPWKDLQRWGVRSAADTILGLDRPLPASYSYVLLGNIAQVSYGIQKSPANRPGEYARPYLRVANVRKGYLDLSEIKEINVPDSELETYRLELGDILFVEGNGSREELGRVAMWNGEISNCVHQNRLIRVRVDRRQLLPEYVVTWFNSEIGRGHFFRSAKTSSGLGTINSEEVRRAPLPLPPLDVQHDIMRRAEAGRAEIARERESAQRRAREAEAEVEALILGTRHL